MEASGACHKTCLLTEFLGTHHNVAIAGVDRCVLEWYQVKHAYAAGQYLAGERLQRHQHKTALIFCLP